MSQVVSPTVSRTHHADRPHVLPVSTSQVELDDDCSAAPVLMSHDTGNLQLAGTGDTSWREGLIGGQRWRHGLVGAQSLRLQRRTSLELDDYGAGQPA